MKRALFVLMVAVFSVSFVSAVEACDHCKKNNVVIVSEHRHCSVCGLVHDGVCAVVGTVRVVGGTTVDAVATTTEVVGNGVSQVGNFFNRAGRRLRRHVGDCFDCRR